MIPIVLVGSFVKLAQRFFWWDPSSFWQSSLAVKYNKLCQTHLLSVLSQINNFLWEALVYLLRNGVSRSQSRLQWHLLLQLLIVLRILSKMNLIFSFQIQDTKFSPNLFYMTSASPPHPIKTLDYQGHRGWQN